MDELVTLEGLRREYLDTIFTKYGAATHIPFTAPLRHHVLRNMEVSDWQDLPLGNSDGFSDCPQPSFCFRDGPRTDIGIGGIVNQISLDLDRGQFLLRRLTSQ